MTAGITTERGDVHEGRSVVFIQRRALFWLRSAEWALTVQGNIEDALELLFRRHIDTTCAGRTDAGVHALCQVISFDLLPDEWFRRKPDSLLKSLNALTHEEISFRSVRPMPEDFSARFSAVMREYRYYILYRCGRAFAHGEVLLASGQAARCRGNETGFYASAGRA